jgi:outer membrane protein TolC
MQMNIYIIQLEAIKKVLKWLIVIPVSIFSCAVFSNELSIEKNDSLDLNAAVKIAVAIDPWLVGNKHSQDAIEAMSISAGTLPDPKVSIGIANLPIDTFDPQQEAMTQSKIGVSQMFPRGDSLAIKKKQLEIMGSQYPYQRYDREAKVAMAVSQFWLDAYKAQESIALIEKDRALFEQLADVAEAAYSSAIGRTRQQDIVRGDLELIQLEDRLTVLKQQQEMFQERLSEWLSDYFADKYLTKGSVANRTSDSKIKLAAKLPDIILLNSQLYKSLNPVGQQMLANYLSEHPAVKGLDQKIQATNIGIDLAKQKYKPEWGVNAAYGYRDDDLLGNDRADLFSVGITFDLPIFTANRQDKELRAAVSQAESVKTEKWLLLRNMMASFETAKAQLIRLNERQELYRSELLPQMYIQAEASLTAYTNDDGDFAEAVRARIAVLNAEIEALNIDVDKQKLIVRLNYLFVNQDNSIEMMLSDGSVAVKENNEMNVKLSSKGVVHVE